ncbi:MAG TPA: vitamin K epoxide reductase family protein [Chthoniobacterales bacterium]|nr:vitamin K epoxide reductase family protein [Chthoniobacterales bacterium]
MKRLYVVAAIVALFGLADGIYLTVEHVTGRTAQCIASSGCQDVLSSKYAAMGPVPLAALGALAYFTAFSLALLAAFGYAKCRTLFGLLVAIMFAMTLWLLYLQAFVLHAFCDYCLFSAGVTTVLTLIALANAFRRAR